MFIKPSDIERLYKSNHICIIGPPGSGKTTLASRLADILGLLVVQMDDITYLFVQKHGRSPTNVEWLTILQDILMKNCLITDGFYIDSILPRFETSDVIIYYNLSTYQCLINAFRRGLKNLFKGTTSHSSTRVSFMTRFIYCFSPRLYIRIIKFYRSYGLILQRHFELLKYAKLIIRLETWQDSEEFIKQIQKRKSI